MISVSEADKMASPFMPVPRLHNAVPQRIEYSEWNVLQTVVTYFGTIHVTKDQGGSTF